MNEVKQTAVFSVLAVALAAITWATAPRVREPGVFADRGELFFPEFKDPNVANSLEVIQFNEQNGSVQPLKVMNRAGIWTVPSHYDYPADARDRLAQTAATIVALRKDDVGSDSPADHERCGVIDPVDAVRPGVKGRGTRVTIRGLNEQPLADIIIGQPVEGHPGFRYVRLPGQKRIYLSRVGDLKMSTDFADWIDRDLLQVQSEEIDGIYIRNYSLDESTGRIKGGETLALRKRNESEWTLEGLQPGEALDPSRVNVLINTLAGLRIAGVLPKPRGISATLGGGSEQAKITVADRDDLARKGFYLTSTGELISNEGEVVVHTATGVFYTLRFGEVAAGMGNTGENRYLFIMAGSDAGSQRQAASRSETSESRAAALRARFAPWYYIIAADEFSKVRARRRELLTTPDTGRPPTPKAKRP